MYQIVPRVGRGQLSKVVQYSYNLLIYNNIILPVNPMLAYLGSWAALYTL